METFLSIIGVFFSLIGAVISIRYAKTAKNEASFIKKIKGNLIEQRTINELSQIQNAFYKLQRSISKYGPAATSDSLKGVNNQDDAKEIQEFVLLLNEYRSLFGTKKPNKADILCNELRCLIEELANAKLNDFETMRKSGKQILMLLSNFSSILKKLIDFKSIKATLK